MAFSRNKYLVENPESGKTETNPLPELFASSAKDRIKNDVPLPFWTGMEVLMGESARSNEYIIHEQCFQTIGKLSSFSS
jgi:hypothetical protein